MKINSAGMANQVSLYGRSKEKYSVDSFILQNVRVDNSTMVAAVNWMLSANNKRSIKVGNFINVNSINLARNNVEFSKVLSSADKSFADGSGVRLGARFQGVNLLDNVNGTDLLPLLCERLSRTEKSIFFLGSSPGVAKRAAEKLMRQYPGLKVVGCHHGYFSADEDADVVRKINQSKADICLVAMGSPQQETWIEQKRHQLNVGCAVAVGGLFDFYSGRIPRAPLWVRKLGCEWVWRLAQEPVKKFNRYVIGNPLFVLHLFFDKRGNNHAAI